MRLLKVELTRLRWRRAVVVLLAGCVLIPAVIFAGVAWNTRPVSDADLRQAQQQVEEQNRMMRGDLENCEANPAQFDIPPGEDPRVLCQRFLGSEEAQVEWFLYRDQLDLGRQRRDSGLGVVTILIALVMLIGTTFVGHDWNNGSMSNQLLFEPRRLRVWAAKAATVFLAGLVVSAVVLAGYWAGMWLLAESRDIETTAATWDRIRNTALRGSVLVALAGLGGYAMTQFFRSTVATLGVLFAFTLGGSLLIASIIGPGSERWLLPTNVIAVLDNGYDYYDGSGQDCFPGAGEMVCDDGMAHLALWQGALYLGVLLAIAVALSLWSFRRRDVP